MLFGHSLVLTHVVEEALCVDVQGEITLPFQAGNQ
jgi:hypothetical protein